ncbi:bifunctional enoyl-CoA hydratase/phosphate acetyltransferase [Stappia sp. 22II-S9-Z10]|nr:bifunctional enoyl-CoA hydratase/phosphate acetyltransferase [Stappia sp. 22II-S9-Z10]
MDYIENRTFDELAVGDSAELTRTLRHEDIELFAVMSGDVNPAHVDADYAAADMFHKVIAHGMWGGALISAVLGTQLPGPGTIYLDQTLKFRRPVGLGDTVTVRVTVAEKIAESKRLKLECLCLNQAGEKVIIGEALVIAPSEKVRRPRVALPAVRINARGTHLRDVIARAAGVPVRVGVIHPVDGDTLTDVAEAKAAGLIDPVLIGPAGAIHAAAAAAGVPLGAIPVQDAPDAMAAARIAVARAKSGTLDALMKGAFDLAALVRTLADEGLGRETSATHVHILDVATYGKPLLVTDAALVPSPTLAEKRDMVANAAALARAMGIRAPKVAVLSASETVDPRLPSTLDAAALCKMAERGQITGALVDGPLAFDTAISRAAAAKRNFGPVAGDADILLVPDLEAGALLVKELIHLAGADAAGIVLGLKVPLIIAGRTGGALPALAAAALAKLLVRRPFAGQAASSSTRAAE